MKANTIVGLDIGSTSIRAIEAVRDKDGSSRVGNFGQCAVPADAVVGGVVKDPKAVTEALRHLWSTTRFAARSVVLGVSHQQVIVREAELTNLPRAELKASLPFQVRDLLPLPVSQVVMDFYPLDVHGEQVRGLLIAAPREAIFDAIEAVEKADLDVAGVDLASFATMRACAYLNRDTEAIVDIGANGTDIVIHTDGVPRIVRSVPRGGAEITRAIAARLGLATPQAEAMKFQYGLLSREHAELTEAAVDALRSLIGEIGSSLAYYSSTNPDDRVRRIALAGGGALLQGLDLHLTRELGIPAFLSDTLQRVVTSRRQKHADALGRARSSASVAIGLTLGAA